MLELLRHNFHIFRGVDLTVLDTLRERGFIYQQTHEQELENHLQQNRTFYVGFDPTADSLHIGHLVPVMAMVHMQKAGHQAIALVGGGTARVGDPSGKSEMRQMLTSNELDANSKKIEQQLKRFLNLDGKQGMLLDNKDWLMKLNYIDFLREVGSRFSVNRMLTAESVKLRLEKGLSFLEFNYMILQAYDFYVLLRDHNCSLQLGGQDQWGNIVAGDDLCRRMGLEKDTFGITLPLLMNSSGTKFGKTEKGALWLDASKTSPLEYYQYFRNSDDADIEKLMKIFTFLPVQEIASLVQANANRAKEILAFEACKICHGPDAAAKAYATAVNQFGSADPDKKITTSSEIVKIDVQAHLEVPTFAVEKKDLMEMNWAALVNAAGFTSSKGEARRLIKGRGVRFEDTVIENAEDKVPSEVYASGSFLLRVGKKKFKKIEVKNG
tara:strand:- start:7299 stop:8615 length:1317 start_codon:yes stop_codon:yes gene_type:complete